MSAIRVLWTTNIVLPTVANELGLTPTPFGGWLHTMLQGLAGRSGLVIGVAMRSPLKEYARIERDGTVFYAVPQASHSSFDVAQAQCERVLADFEPDLVHAQGSEMAFTSRFMRSWVGPRVVSLQGVLHGIAPYHLGQLPLAAMMNPIRPQRMLTAIALIVNERLRFRPRLRSESETIRLADYIIGRTDWDRAHSLAINPNARYVHCGEILRREFHSRAWSVTGCERHSIFIGSSAAPLKGVHFALAAVKRLRVRYPDLKVYIAGPRPGGVRNCSLRAKVGYPAYLLSLVNEMALQDHVVFTGELSASAMAMRMCGSHVYLLPSLIENSPNTLCEAMLMGVPAVAAAVGGVPSIARDGAEALLYRPEDTIMMEYQIQRLFEDDDLCRRLSVAARARAAQTHDTESSISFVDCLYRQIAKRGAGEAQ